MKTIEKKQTYKDSIKQMLLKMKVGTVESWDKTNINHNTFKNTFNTVKRELELEGKGQWMYHYDDDLFNIARISGEDLLAEPIK